MSGMVVPEFGVYFAGFLGVFLFVWDTCLPVWWIGAAMIAWAGYLVLRRGMKCQPGMCFW